MSSSSDEFISGFHSLTGTTIGERRKNLFLLLHLTRQSLQSTDLDLSLLNPKTPLEESFKVDALLFFRRTPDLLDVLKSEKPTLIKKVLRASPWFLDQAFANLTGEEIVTQIFPHVSYNVKLKLANKMAACLKDERKADEAFHAIWKKYGLNLATKVLPACSRDLIVTTFKNYRVKMPPRAMLIIVKKCPEASTEIFSTLQSRSGRKSVGVVYHGVFVYLARSHHREFLGLYGKFGPVFRLGWRATHKLIRAHKQSVLDEASLMSQLLHRKQCVKSFNQDFSLFYQKLLPASISDFTVSLTNLLPFLQQLPPGVDKVTLLEESFKRAYETDLLQHPRCFTNALLDLLPLTKRQGLIYSPTLHISKQRWSCYLPVDQSIPFLKKRLSLCLDFKLRAELVSCLVLTCRINSDTKALDEVCRHMVAQHREDHSFVRTRFLWELKDSFDLAKLDEVSWRCINELLDTFRVNFEPFRLTPEFIAAFVHHRLLKGLDVRDQMAKYLTSRTGRCNLFKQNPNFEKHCLLLAGELLPQIFSKADIRQHHVDFLSSLVCWNKRHPKDEVSLLGYPDAMVSFKEVLEAHALGQSTEDIIEYFLRHKNPVPDDLTVLCLARINSTVFDRRILNWLIWYKPLLVANNLETIVELLLMNLNRFFWRQARNFTHLDIPQTITAACLGILTRDVSGKRADLLRRNAVAALSYLMNPDKFLELSSVYYPTPNTPREESRTDEERRRYKLQRAVATNLKNVVPPSLALGGVLRFSRGDYLKLNLTSMYSVSGTVNEDKLQMFLTELSGRTTSVRKHTIHLTLRVLDRNLIHNVFSQFMEERNSSIRQFLVKASFQLFVQDPSDILWVLLQSNVSRADVEDREVVKLLMQIGKIPPQYQLRYFLILWEFLQKLPDHQGDRYGQTQKLALLRALPTKTIQELDQDFALATTSEHFFKFNDQHQVIGNLNNFVCQFLIYCQSETEQKQRMDLIVNTLKPCMLEPRRRSAVDRFIRHFCDEFLHRRSQSSKTLSMFAARWSFRVRPEQAFEQYVYLQLTLVFLDAVNFDWSPSEIGQKLALFCDSVAGAYGTSVIAVLCHVLQLFIPKYCGGGSTGATEEANRYILIKGILLASSSTTCAIMAISLLKRCLGYSATQPRHDEILRMLIEAKNSIVQIHLNHHLYRM